MEIEFTLNIKALSYNQYYRNSKTGKRIKTGAGHAYDEELELLLEDHADALQSFGNHLDPSKNIVKFTIIKFNSSYFIKDGSRLNKTSGDTDNIVKALQDKLFKVAEQDDYFIKHLNVIELPAKNDKIYINLKVEDFPRLPLE